jgi:hypothetical protein
MNMLGLSLYVLASQNLNWSPRVCTHTFKWGLQLMTEFHIPRVFVACVCHVHCSPTTDPSATEVRDMEASVIAD